MKDKNLKKHILVISQYFYPEQFRINDICTEWVKRGYKVTVITGIPNYPQGKFYEGYGVLRRKREMYKGIEIIRIPIIPRGKNPIMLSLNYLSFVISGFIWSIFTRIKADIVFIYEVSPMTQALPGVWYSKKREIPCYIYVTDLWPDNVEIVTGIKNKFFIGCLGKMVDYIYKNCTRIFTSSNSFIDSIKERGVSEQILEYWPQYAEDFYKPITKEKIHSNQIPKDGKFNIIFAGNIGIAQGLDILPKAAQILSKKNINVRFNIVGDGRFKRNLINMVNENNLEDMFIFIDKLPANRIPDLMSVCDAALICLSKSKVFSITLPAKTQSCLACGIPIIVSADGEIQNVIAEANAGLCSNSGDYYMLADKIEELISKTKNELIEMRNNGIKYSNDKFNKEKLLSRMDGIFNSK